MKKFYKVLLVLILLSALIFLPACKKSNSATIKGERSVLEGEQITLSIETDIETYSLKWTSSNPEVASINPNGVVTGIKEGTTEIRVTINDMVLDAIVTVTKFEINISCEKYLHIGDKTKMVVTHNSKLEKEVFFVSSNADVATISQDGEIEALSEGETTITVTVGGKKKNFLLKVLPIGEEIPIDDPPIDDPVDDPVDDPTDEPGPVVIPIEIYVPTIIKYDDCIIATANRDVTWYSSDPDNILFFNEENEIVLMGGFGPVTIKAVDVNNKDAYVEKVVYVVLTDVAPKEIEIYNEEGVYEVALEKVGGIVSSSLQLKVRAVNSSDDADTTVVWTTSDESVAAIGKSGLVVPNKIGTVTIKAVSVHDETVYATVTIKVVSSTGK